MLNTILLQAATGGAADYSGLIMIVVLIAIFYFFMIRPQNKRQKKSARSAKLEKGSRVITSGGIYGKVCDKKENTFLIEITNGVKITVDKNSVYPAADADAAVQDNAAK